jgi:glycosyltransferase involved in cell wall biosynthesis
MEPFPMKVVQLVPELESGGVERGTVELAHHLTESGHESVVISGGGRMVAELERDGSRHIAMPVGRKSAASLLLVPKLRKWFVREQPDIVHAASRVPAWLAWLAWRGMAPATRPRLVTAMHGFHSVNRWSEIMTRGERVICVSESIRRHILENYPKARAENLRVVNRGIDPALYPHGFRPAADWTSAFFKEFPATRGKRLITLPGRITRLKGHRDLLEILAALPDESIHALVVGGTHPKRRAYRDELVGAIEAAGLADRVTLTGPRTDLREILAVSDVVLSLSSQPESFGRTTLEALGLGRPVVGYDRGGVGELLAVLLPEGRVPPGDTVAATETVRRFLENPPQIPAAHPFTLQAMLEGTVEVYRELIASPR